MAKDELPRRENKEQRKADQEAAARAERDRINRKGSGAAGDQSGRRAGAGDKGYENNR